MDEILRYDNSNETILSMQTELNRGSRFLLRKVILVLSLVEVPKRNYFNERTLNRTFFPMVLLLGAPWKVVFQISR